MGERLGQELVPDGLWELVEPLIPPQTERPQGGGTQGLGKVVMQVDGPR
jgi:hypothetical protein